MGRNKCYPFRDYDTLEREKEYKDNAFILEHPEDTDEEYEIKDEFSGHLDELPEVISYQRGYLQGIKDAKEQMEKLMNSSTNENLKETEEELNWCREEMLKWKDKFNQTFRKVGEEEK